MNILRFLILSFLCIGTLGAQSVPLSISFQGVLTNDAGEVIAAEQPTNRNIEFRIYDSAQAGNLLWSEAQTVSVFKGNFSTLLGTGDTVGSEPNPSLDTVFLQPDRFLEITLLGESTPVVFSPRQQMVSTPFALQARKADEATTVTDGGVSTLQLASGSVTDAKLSASAVTTEKLADDAVVSNKIAEGAVSSTQIANGGIHLDDLANTIMKRLVPAGSLIAWTGHDQASTINGVAISGVPDGWLLCQGQIVSRADYPELFSTIGHTYSLAGDNTTGNDFRLPDYRGMFLRGYAEDASQDPDIDTRSIKPWLASAGGREGSTQADEFKAHNHENGSYKYLLRRSGIWTANSGDNGGAPQPDLAHSAALKSAGGAETRPKNTYVHYIIKAH